MSDFGNSSGNPDGGRQRYHGIYPALVTDARPDDLGRIELRLPWLGPEGGSGDDFDDGENLTRATLVTPYAEADQGFQFVPSVGAQVMVMFEGGHLHRAYVLGSCWNGQARLPQPEDGQTNLRSITTRSGHLLEFDDTPAGEKITVQSAGGHRLVLDDAAGGTITLEHSNGVSITLTVAGAVEIRANASVEITAPVLNAHVAAANLDGLVTCTTLIAQTGVVSPSYTPGAGNVW